MYFVALLLTLRRPLEKISHAQEELSFVCQAVKDVLTQAAQPNSYAFLNVALLTQTRLSMTLRVTFAEHALGSETPHVLQVLLSFPGITLNRHTYLVESLDLTRSPWTGISTWTDIFHSKSSSLIRFSFATPLLTVEPQERSISEIGPFPEAVLLFSHLQQYWNAFDGPELAQDIEQVVLSSRCTVSNYRLHTTSAKRAGKHCAGYLGWIEYECRNRQGPDVVTLCALARLAFFSGVGACTEDGMGVTSVTLFY